MGRYAVVVIGPAGSGKTSFCEVLSKYAETAKRRTVHCVNMDPATLDPPYPVAFDIRDIITANDTQTADNLGPNGALVRCMEYVLKDDSWVSETFGQYEDDYILFDFPGQVELFSQIPIVPTFVEKLQRESYFVAVVFLLDAGSVIADSHKYVSACLVALGAMVAVDVPFVSLLTKTDLLEETVRENLSDYLQCSFELLPSTTSAQRRSEKYQELTRKLCSLISDYNLVNFVPWSVTEEDTVSYVLEQLDLVLQFGEDAEPRTPPWGEATDEGTELM